MAKSQIESLRVEILALKMQINELDRRLEKVALEEAPEYAISKSKSTSSKSTEFPLAAHIPVPSLNDEPQHSGFWTGNLLGIVASVCFILAGIFLIRLSIQSGWLTPLRQFGLAVLLGFTLIFTGLRARYHDPKYSGFLPGCGVVVLSACAVGGHRYFQLYDATLAMISMALVSFFCLWIFTRFKHDFFIVTAALGTYFLPFLLEDNGAQLWQVGSYFLIWTFTYSVASVFLKTRLLPLIAGYLGMGLLEIISEFKPDHDIAAVIQFVQFLILACGIAWYTIKSKLPLSTKEAWSYFPLALFFYGVEYRHLQYVMPQLAPWVCLGFAGLLMAIYFNVKNQLGKNQLESSQMLVSWASVIGFHSGYLQLIPDGFKPYLLLLFLFVTPLVRARTQISGSTIYKGQPVFVLITFLILAIEYGRILMDTNGLNINFLALLVGTGVLFFYLTFFRNNVRSKKESELSYFILIAGHLQAIVGLYSWTHSYGTLAISLAWAVYSSSVLAIGFKFKDQTLSYSSLIVLLISAGKVLLYDSANAPSGVRILCLFLTGALLYGSGFVFRKISVWSQKMPTAIR